MFFRKIILPILCVIIYSNANAQAFLGVHSSNYDALRGQTFNAAFPATTEMKWQVNLIGVDLDISNDYFKINGGISDLISGFDRETSITENTDNETANVNLGGNIPAIGFMFHHKKAGAFSFTTRARFIVDAGGIGTDLLTSIYNDANNIYNWFSDIEDQSAAINVHAFGEIGIGYSRRFNINERHALSGGVNAKLLTRGAAAKFSAQDLKITIDDATDEANFNTTTAQFLSSDLLNLIDEDEYEYKFGIHGVGFDAGLVYEFKRKENDALISRKKEPKKQRVQPSHLIKIGVGINDLGKLSYQNSNYSRSFISDGNIVDLNDITNSDSGFVDLDLVLDSFGTFTQPIGEFDVKLPTSLSFFADVQLHRLFYVNFSSVINIGTFSEDNAKAKLLNTYSLTPRFELPAVGLYAPMSYNKYNGFEMGAAVRFSNFVIGSSNLLSYLWNKEAAAFNVQFAMSFGGVHKNKKGKNKSNIEDAEL